MVKDREAWHATVHAVAESDMTEWLKNNPCVRGTQKVFTVYQMWDYVLEAPRKCSLFTKRGTRQQNDFLATSRI